MFACRRGCECRHAAHVRLDVDVGAPWGECLRGSVCGKVCVPVSLCLRLIHHRRFNAGTPPPNFPPRTSPTVNLSWQQFSLFLYLHRIFIDAKHRGRWCPNLRTPKAGENVVALAWKIGGKREKASNWHYHPFSHPPLCSFPQLPLTPRRLEGHPRRLEGHPRRLEGHPRREGSRRTCTSEPDIFRTRAAE